MKIKSLLAAVSMAALIAPAANAIEVTSAANSTAFNAPLALELDLASEGVPGTLMVNVSPDDMGFFNQGVQHDVVVTLPAGMTFDNGPGGTPPSIVGSNQEQGNIFTGGDAGDSTVTFQIAPNPSQQTGTCLLYTSPSPRDRTRSRMPSSA